MQDVVVEVAPEFVAALYPDAPDVGRAILEDLLFELFRRGEVSRGRASELLGIPLAEFLALASSRKIGVVSL